MPSEQHPINTLKKQKGNLSDLLSKILLHGELYKNGVDYLHNEIKKINYHLPTLNIKINELQRQTLKGILGDLSDSREKWYYGANSDEFKFVIDLTREIEIGILQKIQNEVQTELTLFKQSTTSLARTFTPTQHRKYNDKKRELKNTVKNKWEAVIEKNKYQLELIKEERNINFGDRIQKIENLQKDLEQGLNLLKSSDKKIMRSEEYDSTKETLKSQLHEARKEKWQTVLDQTFEEKRNKPLNEVADETGSDYIKRKIKNNDYTGNYVYKRPNNGGMLSLGEVLDRANPTYQDKKILLTWYIHQVEVLLEDETLTKGNRKALKEIYQDLKDEMKKSKKDFDPQNDEYIQRFKETRNVPQSTLQEALVQKGQRNILIASMLMF